MQDKYVGGGEGGGSRSVISSNDSFCLSGSVIVLQCLFGKWNVTLTYLLSSTSFGKNETTGSSTGVEVSNGTCWQYTLAKSLTLKVTKSYF